MKYLDSNSQWGVMLKLEDQYNPISAKGTPKMLNLATIEMKTFWPKMTFKCYPRMKKNA